MTDNTRDAAYRAAHAAIQEEFDERGLGDASLIARVAVDEAFDAVAPAETLSVHRFRCAARREERHVRYLVTTFPGATAGIGIPGWARDVRVERIGLFRHAVVAATHPPEGEAR